MPSLPSKSSIWTYKSRMDDLRDNLRRTLQHEACSIAVYILKNDLVIEVRHRLDLHETNITKYTYDWKKIYQHDYIFDEIVLMETFGVK